MTITTLDALSDEQQEVWATIPGEYLDILHNMSLDEQFQYLGIRRKDYYICDTFHEEPCLLSYDCDGNEDVFTYDGVIVAVQITNRPLLRLGIPYKETVIEDQEYMDSHTHEIVRYSNVPYTYYNVLCYSLEHPRFQELLAKKEEEKKRAKEAALLADHQAAENGSVEACLRLAHHYEWEWYRDRFRGELLLEAVRWLQRAAEQKDAEALHRLAEMLTKTLHFYRISWKEEALSHCYQLAKAAGDEAVMRSIERELS